MSESERDEREEIRADVRAALTPDAVRAGTRARLVARASADSSARGAAPVRAPDRAEALADPAAPKTPTLTVSRGGGVSVPVFSAVALALAASLVFMFKVRSDANDARSAFAAADQAATRRIDSLQTLVASRDQLVASLTGAQVRVVGLSAGQIKSPGALMFWDKATDRWTFIAHNLAQLSAGRTYQLWLVTASSKISAGTFTVGAGGNAFVQATYALDRNALKAVAVTEEPAGGVVQPTGAMVVVGTIQ